MNLDQYMDSLSFSKGGPVDPDPTAPASTTGVSIGGMPSNLIDQEKNVALRDIRNAAHLERLRNTLPANPDIEAAQRQHSQQQRNSTISKSTAVPPNAMFMYPNLHGATKQGVTEQANVEIAGELAGYGAGRAVRAAYRSGIPQAATDKVNYLRDGVRAKLQNIQDDFYHTKASMKDAAEKLVKGGKDGLSPQTFLQPRSEVTHAQSLVDDASDLVKYWYYEENPSALSPSGSLRLRPDREAKIMAMAGVKPQSIFHNVPRIPEAFYTGPLTTKAHAVNRLNQNLAGEHVSIGNNLGVHLGLENTANTATRRGLFKKISDGEIYHTAGHEYDHAMQNMHVVDGRDPYNPYPHWKGNTTRYSPELNYWTSNPETELGKRFEEALVKADKPGHDAWLSSPMELKSEKMGVLIRDAHRYASEKEHKWGTPAWKMATRDYLDNVRRMESEYPDKVADYLDQNLQRHFDESTPYSERIELLKMLPAATGIGVAANEVRQYATGGKVSLDDFMDSIR